MTRVYLTIFLCLVLASRVWSQNNIYTNYDQTFYFSDFVNASTGGGSVRVIISNDVLTVIMSAGFPSSTLKTGNVKYLNTSPLLPNMDLGYIANGAYLISVKSNYIYVTGSGLVSGFNNTLTKELIENFTLYPDQNYIITTTPQGVAKSDAELNRLLIEDKQISVNYFDGLARLSQTIDKKASPSKKDIIVGHVYDQRGRETKNFLPYESSSTNNNAAWDYSMTNNVASFYNGSQTGIPQTSYYYSESQFENSPYSRAIKTAAPGEIWRMGTGHEIAYDSRLNVTGDNIYKLTHQNPTLSDLTSAPYAASKLNVLITSDENGIKSYEFKNADGLIVCKVNDTDSGTYKAKTYYIYNKLNQLSFVVPPQAVNIIERSSYNWNLLKDVNFQNRWLFKYNYDKYGRMYQKKVPGAEPVFLIYDKKDRLVLTQDGNLRNGSPSKWSFTKYDKLDRVLYTGIVNLDGTREYVQGIVDNQTVIDEEYTGLTSFSGYTNNLLTSFIVEDNLLTVSYYDNYAFLSIPQWDLEGNSYTNASTYKTLTSQLTGSKTRVLNSSKWLNAVNYYDSKNRLVSSYIEHHLNGLDIITNTYKSVVSSLLVQSKQVHKLGTSTTTIITDYEYDHAQRLTKVYHKINNQPRILLSEFVYNALGEKIEQNLHFDPSRKEFIQSVDYAYNIRGWLEKINGNSDVETVPDAFQMEIGYSGNLGLSNVTPQYNGNISSTTWKHLDEEKQGYKYSYDKLNRLKSGTYVNVSTPTKNGYFNEDDLNYDWNGNILTLNRFDNVKTDDLDYFYNGNQLHTVTDVGNNTQGFSDGNVGSTDYGYDDNGNLTQDKNKDISSISYNHLNLPDLITFTNGTSVAYTYDASGKKLKVISGSTTKDYIHNIHYRNGSIDFISQDYGRLVKVDNTFDYEYFLTDHLGNVRASIANNVVETTLSQTYTYNFDGNDAQTIGGLRNTTNVSAPHSLYLRNPLIGNYTVSFDLPIKNGERIDLDVQARIGAITTATIVLKQISSTGADLGTIGSVSISSNPYVWQALKITNALATANGFLRVTLTNTVPNGADAYFDNLSIKVSSVKRIPQIVQKDDYYPFGMTFNSYNSGSKNNYLYNQGSEKNFQGEEGKSFEVERQLELELDMTKYRMYDYALGRFTSVDPLADANPQESLTPYQYGYNNPIRFNDPEGDCPWCIGAVVGLAVEYTSQVVGNVIENGGEVNLGVFTNVDATDLLLATAAGAATGGLGAMGKKFTETAIVGGVATVTALSEGVKAAVDVKVDVRTGETEMQSIYTGNKSGTKAAVEFATGNLPTPDVTSKSVGDAVNAGAEWVIGSIKSVLEEGINAQANDKSKKK